MFNNICLAFRSLRQRAGLSAVVILMLAFGIGATTALFSLFHQILVQPLPVPDPQRVLFTEPSEFRNVEQTIGDLQSASTLHLSHSPPLLQLRSGTADKARRPSDSRRRGRFERLAANRSAMGLHCTAPEAPREGETHP